MLSDSLQCLHDLIYWEKYDSGMMEEESVVTQQILALKGNDLVGKLVNHDNKVVSQWACQISELLQAQ